MIHGIRMCHQLLNVCLIRRSDGRPNRFNRVRHINEFRIILIDQCLHGRIIRPDL